MRADYQNYSYALKSNLIDLRVECVAESQLFADFSFPNRWLLRLEGERYAHGIFSISLSQTASLDLMCGC